MTAVSEERKALMRAYYRANKHRWKTPEYREQGRQWKADNESRVREAARKRRIALRQFVYAVKSAPCTDCGQSFPPYVMDLDHIGDDKHMDVSTMVDNCCSLAKVKAEIKKCEVVCSNCHRIRTHERRGTQV